MKNLTYIDIIKANKELKGQNTDEIFPIALLSNVIVHQFCEIFEYAIQQSGINGHIQIGDYDNIVQDSEKFAQSKLIIIFWEVSNIVDGLQYKINTITDDEFDSLIGKVKGEIGFVFERLKETSLVIFNLFSSSAFNCYNLKNNRLDKLCCELNLYVQKNAPGNVKFVNSDKIYSQISITKSFDWRYFYSSKALYTVNFFKAYASHILPIILSAQGKAKKALIFDCDNTLWKGILGEDGFEGIQMSGKTKGGIVFEEVQHIALELNRRGIIIGLCSKNNPDDIDQVISSHLDMTLREENITIKMVNWNDKVSNLRDIAKILNIGLDSIVFIDDSDFEVNFVKEHLSEVTVLQVPKKLSDYPMYLRSHLGLFYNISETNEDAKKIGMYKQQANRESEKDAFSDIESYLKSLGLKITLYIDSEKLIPRMAQMTQKTNQFNLTTKRYTENDIRTFVESPDYSVFAIGVEDKFGDSGVTGLSIVKNDFDKKLSDIDTFLMSCRILGRKVEFKFFDLIMDVLKDSEIKRVSAKYFKTLKNSQVLEFYDNFGFMIENSDEKTKSYSMDTTAYQSGNVEYIGVRHGK